SFWAAPWENRSGLGLGEVGLGGIGLGGIVADDDRVEHGEYLVARHADPAGVLADRLGIARLVDADGAHAAVGLADGVAAAPAHLVGHFFVADLGRLGAGGLELVDVRPGTRAADDVEVHDILLIANVAMGRI